MRKQPLRPIQGTCRAECHVHVRRQPRRQPLPPPLMPPQAGAVAGLRRIKQAARTARLVMEHTSHTLLAGDLATRFALEMGLQESNLSSAHSLHAWHSW